MCRTLLAAVHTLENGDIPNKWLLDEEPKKLNKYFRTMYLTDIVVINKVTYLNQQASKFPSVICVQTQVRTLNTLRTVQSTLHTTYSKLIYNNTLHTLQ